MWKIHLDLFLSKPLYEEVLDLFGKMIGEDKILFHAKSFHLPCKQYFLPRPLTPGFCTCEIISIFSDSVNGLLATKMRMRDDLE